jgi:hypothetical protein
VNRHDGTFTGMLLRVLSSAAGMDFLTSRSQGNDYVSESSATCSGRVPGPGGLFELAFPLLLIVRCSSGRTDARLVRVSVGGAG